ncbi:MAG: M16 family metallopeptidase [bacterium]
MARMTRILATAALAWAALAAPVGAAVDKSIFDPRKLPTPPIGRIPAVNPERMVLPNGAVVYLLEDRSLPTVYGIAYFPSSPALVPAERAGLASVAGDVIRDGGTARNTGDYLDDRLAAIGANLTSNVGATQASTGFRCLTENTAEVVALWADMTRVPAFPDDKIELSKVALRQSIASRNDEMMSMLMRTARHAVYGKDSPWARMPEYATVEPISAADCRTMHAQVFVPERMVRAIYGDFRSADMRKLLLAQWGDWKRSGTAKPVLPPTPKSVELVALDKPESVDGVDYRAAAVKGSSRTDHVLLVTADGRFAGSAFMDEGNAQMGPARTVELRGDWKPVGAIQYPHSVKLYRDGKVFMDAKVTKVELNVAVTDAMFAKPTK